MGFPKIKEHFGYNFMISILFFAIYVFALLYLAKLFSSVVTIPRDLTFQSMNVGEWLVYTNNRALFISRSRFGFKSWGSFGSQSQPRIPPHPKTMFLFSYTM